jgi:hypothetical protein
MRNIASLWIVSCSSTENLANTLYIEYLISIPGSSIRSTMLYTKLKGPVFSSRYTSLFQRTFMCMFCKQYSNGRRKCVNILLWLIEQPLRIKLARRLLYPGMWLWIISLCVIPGRMMPTFRKNFLLPSSLYKSNPRGEGRKRNWAAEGPTGEGKAKRLRDKHFWNEKENIFLLLLLLIYFLQKRDKMFFRNINSFIPDYTVSHSRT